MQQMKEMYLITKCKTFYTVNFSSISVFHFVHDKLLSPFFLNIVY